MSDESVPVCEGFKDGDFVCRHTPEDMERQIGSVAFSFKGGPPTRKFHDR